MPLLFATGLAAVPAHAGALPAAVDGEALPSLAPMLERITPAVVNVASRRSVQVRSPFMDDPFFRR
ncbi:MAG TPA: heat-shock protein, partial [Pseudomonadota bacterium]|nr:heat-shock protein [Pseudomonadota bacterium]